MSAMRYAFAILLLFVADAFAQSPATRQAATRSAGLTVFVITIGPGDAVWERFGHNLIRLHPLPSGADVAANWGVFDFDQPNFIGRFVLGKMLYSVDVIPTQAAWDEYLPADRSITQQELNLSPTQRETLVRRIGTNLQPGNRDYRYDYYTDNCSTRVRDHLDAALGGQLRGATEKTLTNLTYRDHALRAMGDDWFVSTGADLLLGRPTDRKLNGWEVLFLPDELSKTLAALRVSDGGSGGTRPLVTAVAVTPSKSRQPLPADPPKRWVSLVLIGLVWAGVAFGLTRLGKWPRRGGAALLVIWNLFAGVAGLMMLFFWLFTDHTAAYRNENAILFSPLCLLVAGLLTQLRRPAARRWATRLSAVVVGLIVPALLVKLLPGDAQANGGWIGLALLLHAATLGVIRTSAWHGLPACERNA